MKFKLSTSLQQWLGVLCAIVLMFFLLKPIFKDYFTRPNQRMYAFGGDALTLYYNAIYHAKYGEDNMLRSMNYPDGEYIYLTDAQGAVMWVVNRLRQFIPNISDYVVGIYHSLNLYLLFPAVVFVFFLLRAFAVRWLSAVLFSPLIILLSPPMLRLGGHFALAYPFLIPMTMLWFVRKYRNGRLEWMDAAMFAVLLFFTYNQPYNGINNSFLLLLGGGLLFLLEDYKQKTWKRPAIIAGMGLVSLLWVFIDFKLFDPVQDRLNPQWGFFSYRARLEGLFHPAGSLLYDWLKKLNIMVVDTDFESKLNLGFVCTAAVFSMLILALIARFKKVGKPLVQRLLPQHRILLWSALLLFILAANVSVVPVPAEVLERYMGFLTMFKASGRLAWPLYFILTVTAVVFIDRLFRRSGGQYLGWLLPVGAAVWWNAEINQYVAPNYRDCFHDNFFHPRFQREVLAEITARQVNPAEYQAMLCLPKMVSWNDKVLSRIHFETQHHGMKVSLATGLPMISAMLSRMGLQHALDRVQMSTDPIVQKSLIEKLPNQKDILILLGNNAPPLSAGEQHLLDISEPLFKNDHFALFRLRLKSLAENPYIDRAKAAYRAGQFAQPSWYTGYEETPAAIHFYGKGSHVTTPPQEMLFKYFSPFDRDTTMVFAGWTYLDIGQWGPGDWVLSVRDTSGYEINKIVLETRRSNDVQEHWLRASGRFVLPKSAHLAVYARGGKPMCIDELMLWPEAGTPLVDNPDSDHFLYNNFKVKK